MLKMKGFIKSFIELRLCVVVAGFLFTPNVALAQRKALKIDELMTQHHNAGQFNGSVLVAERGKVIHRESFGFANFEWDIPNSPDTKFRIGSITKSFTAILILQLVERGKLKLEGKVTDLSAERFQENGRQNKRQSNASAYLGLAGL